MVNIFQFVGPVSRYGPDPEPDPAKDEMAERLKEVYAKYYADTLQAFSAETSTKGFHLLKF